ncbi:MAG: M48 family metallopeptidase [Idiomarina sp.]|nr:M48 family metallopeptidase [Idiomarina sp.]
MKHIRLRVTEPDGALYVSAPPRVPEFVIRAFVKSKDSWITKQRERIALLPPKPPLDVEYCRATMQREVPKLIQHWSKSLGVDCAGWRMRRMKTRWGSCNTKTHWINLNLELGQLPLPLLEYVVVHELVHLHERYHNARFYQLLESQLPDWRGREADLRVIQL